VQLLPLTTVEWMAIAASALLVGLTKAGFGAGAGILAVPLMTMALAAREDAATLMLGIMLPVLICGDIFSLVHYPRTRDLRNLAMLVPGALLGVGLGMLLLGWFVELPGGRLVMRRAIGVICTVFVCIQLHGFFRERREDVRSQPYRPRVWHGVGIGTIAGLTSTLAHAAGPLIALFLIPQKLGRRLFVGTCVTYFFIGNLAKLYPYLQGGVIKLGALLNRRINDRIFTLIILCLALGTGIYLIVR